MLRIWVNSNPNVFLEDNINSIFLSKRESGLDIYYTWIHPKMEFNQDRKHIAVLQNHNNFFMGKINI